MADGKVIIEIDADSEGLEGKLDSVKKKSSDVMQSVGSSLSGAGKSISKVGSTMTKYVTQPVLAAGAAAVKFASDYEENLNKVDASFKENAQTVKDWAKTATEQFGMSESAALEATSLFGDMGTSMGLTTGAAADMSTGLAGLAGDLASFKNIGIDQAMTALKGVFTGETESLKTLGVVMTETNLKEFAKGLGLVYDEMSQAEKVTLRYKYVLANTKNAQGDYARTSDGTANSMRTLKSSVENLGAAFGQELLPEITPVIQKATELIKGFGDLDDSTKQSVIHLGLVAAAAGPVTSAFGKTTEGIGKAVTGFGKLKDAVSDTNLNFTGVVGPIGLAAGAVMAFVGVTGAIAESQNRANAEMQLASDSLSGIERRAREATAAYQDSISSIDAEGDSVMRLANSLVSLVDSGDRSTATQTQIKSIVDQLNESVPNLGLAYDELTGKLNMTTDAILAMAEAEIARRKYEEMDGQLVTLLEERAKAEERLAEAKEEQAEAQAAYNKANQEYLDHLNDAPSVVSEYRDALNNASDDLQDAKEYTNDCQEAYDGLCGEAEDLSAQMGELSSAEKKATKSAEDNADALDDQSQAAKEATQELGKIGSAAYKAMGSSDDLRESYDDLKKQLDDLGESGDEETRRLAERALATLNLAATNQELSSSYALMGIDVGNSLTSMSAFLNAAEISADEFASGVTSMRDSVVNDFQLIADSNKITADQMVANLEANLQTQQAWSSNLTELWNQAYANQDTSVMAFINYLAQKGPEYAGVVAEFANGGYSKLQEAAGSWSGIGEQSASDYAAGIWMQQYLSGEAGTALGQGSIDAAGLLDYGTGGQTAGTSWVSGFASTDGQGAGQAVMQSVVSGMGTQTGAVQSKAQELADAVTTTWRNADSKFKQSGETAGRSIKAGLDNKKAAIKTSAQLLADAVNSAWAGKAASFTSSGSTAAASIAGGISSGQSGITSAASSAAGAAYGAFTSLSWYSLGYNISAGIASGVRGGSYLITRAATSAAQSALSAAKSALGVHSPSRVFRDEIGKMIPAGMALGIEKGTPEAEKALKLSADQLLRATNIALRPSGNLSPAQSFTTNNTYYGGGSGGGNLELTVSPILELDGREVARATAKYTGQRMAYLGGTS